MAGDGMLHPVVLGAVALLIVNDQILKSLAPGVVTGKVSDVAGLVFFPALIVAAPEVVLALLGRWRGPRASLIVAAVVATGFVFAAVKLFAAGEAAYEVVLGIAQWPFGAVAAILGGAAPGQPVAVELHRDPTDLVALAALWVPYHLGRRRTNVAAAVAPAEATVRLYELVVATLSVALLVGAILDGWAHSHDRLALEALITPWHAVVYLSFVAVAVVVLAPPVTGWLGGHGARASIPLGFDGSVAGVFVFGAVGVADAAWHLAFGIEADAEALLSPTHLGLAVGAGMIASGPIRAAWLRAPGGGGGQAGVDADWPAFLPAALSVVAITGLVAFALHIANLFVDPWPRFPYGRSDVTWYGPNIGVASAIVQTAVLITPILLLLRRWGSLPPGFMTLVVGGTTAGLTFLHDEGGLVGAPVLAGFFADLVLLALRPGGGRWRLPAFGFAAPAVIFIAYFIVLDATGPIAWSAHLIGGTIVLAGGTGLTLALLAGGPPQRADEFARARKSRGGG